ncbi:cytidine deaminase 1-like [Lotus japonicus]|uniref:cytidine deaminase 1-like n=1 Tax=Lotus japonicus TaxID=34305 RepID=UPI00258DA19A|nr:cytidine deaminase 1-like [Lotus japonicus]
MDHPRFIIEASEAESMAKSSGLTLPQLLPSLVRSSQSLARAPISKFQVAAVAVGASGRIFIGVNLEFPGLPFHHTVHAEQFLLTNLALNAETQLRWLAVSAAPCGHCRQFLQEIRDAPNIELLITDNDDPSFTPLSHFLTHPFGPHDLLPKGVPLLLEPRHNNLTFSGDYSPCSDNVLSNGDTPMISQKLKFAALEAANASHAPYSGCPSGVALLDSQGKIYRGSYMESAAYNPSLGPLQTALIAYVAAGAADYDGVVAAVLVEKDGAVVRQETTARLLLQEISPQCQFKAFLCTSAD